MSTETITTSDIQTVVIGEIATSKPIPLTLKPDGDTLIADVGDFRVTLAQQEDTWWFMLSRKGVRIARGRSLEKNNQVGVLRAAGKALKQCLTMEPHLGTCTACGGDTWPSTAGIGKDGKIITDEAWYQARAAASKEFFGKEIPDHMVLRCLDPDCELHKQPQRRA